MILEIDTENKNSITTYEVLLLLFFNYEQPSAQVLSNLIEKGLIKKTSVREITDTGVKYRLTVEGQNLLNSCLRSSAPLNNNEIKVKEERLSNLVKQLRDIFPKGKKDNTNTVWSEGPTFIKKRLLAFFRKYGDVYTDDQIINAAKTYVDSFNGNYTFMRTLKYFIFKDEKGVDGHIESTSDLINIIENEGSIENKDRDWTSKLV